MQVDQVDDLFIKMRLRKEAPFWSLNRSV